MNSAIRAACLGLIISAGALSAAAETAIAAGAYRTCPAAQALEGREAVKATCGALARPAVPAAFNSETDLASARSARDTFLAQVSTYGRCVSGFIDSYRRPGAPATSRAPDQAACAHAWAEDQATDAVRAFGRACIAFSNRSMRDPALKPWSGDCYPVQN